MKKLAIIGGGPAGYTAAERAAHNGLSVVLFEKNTLGGTCLNEGCIPTKALLYSAKMYANALHATKYGVTTENVTFDYAKMYSRKTKVVRKLVAGIKSKLSHCEIIQGEAKVVNYTPEKITIACNDEIYEAEYLLLCTGSENLVPPIPGILSETVWDSSVALSTNQLPESIAIVGGGVIGMEFAALYHTLGVKVSVIEMQSEILGNMDVEMSTLLRTDFAKRGIAFYLQAKVTEINDNELIFEYEGEQKSIQAERILMSVGRKPNLKGSECLNLETFRAGLAVTPTMQTSLQHVYAAGDITGYSMLAHTAVREAEVAVNNICGIADQMRYNAIPSVVYTQPEVAGVGETEIALIRKNITYKVQKLPMAYSGRFVAENEATNGLCKVLCDANTEQILGVHIVGNPASEIINTATLAIEQGLTLEVWRKSVFGHPTVSEIIKETIHSSFV